MGRWAGGREDRCIIFSQLLFVLLSILLRMHVQQADEDENSCCMYVCMYVFMHACLIASFRLDKQSHLKSFLVPVYAASYDDSFLLLCPFRNIDSSAEDFSRRRHLRNHIKVNMCMDSREQGRPNIYVGMQF